jgi:hypothetical protein
MDDLSPAERDLLGFLRAAGADFTITINRSKDRWTVSTNERGHDRVGDYRGKGASFTDAWALQCPPWRRACGTRAAS